MNQQTMLVTIGCLLHDIGKIVYRAGAEEGNHRQAGYRFLKALWPMPEAAPILDCVRWHHAADLRQSKPEPDNLAYIANLADNISAAADRRTLDGAEGRFDRTLPLQPVFSHLNGEHPGHTVPLSPQDGMLRLPGTEQTELTAGQYAGILENLRHELTGIPPTEPWIHSLLTVLECYTSAVPSSTNTGESPDISLYDHMKISAAVGACISEYCLSHGITDFAQTLFREEASFRTQPVFLLYSADFSGIQKFIYSVSTRNALKSLRSRSFFLELTMEHYIDELLTACGVSRANLLYSGGGHCYLLLPNTDTVTQVLAQWNDRFNRWLTEQFGIQLFLAHGWTPCSANDLTNTPAPEAPYREIFRRVSRAVSQHKLHRYSAEQIIQMNTGNEGGSRECCICGRADHLVTDRDGRDICHWCRRFETLSVGIQTKDFYLVCSGNDEQAAFVLPGVAGDASFYLADENWVRQQLKSRHNILRIYTKNQPYAGLTYSTRIYVGDYAYSNSMEELADSSEGIRRLAVCRMDVDNLGQSFVSGYVQKSLSSLEEQQHYVTISRTAAFSRQMSLFFKCYINPILNGSYQGDTPLKVSIVYSGGDDVFLVGAWTDILDAAMRIQKAFSAFTCGALTISAGIGLFHDHFPIRLAASQTAALEDEAKQQPSKNAVALLETGGKHVYDWDTFTQSVVADKYITLTDFFESESNERGMAFLYQLTALVRAYQSDPQEKIPLARCAYLLARMEPHRSDPSYKDYIVFSRKMYQWILDPVSSRELLTAIYLFVYRSRKRKEQ